MVVIYTDLDLKFPIREGTRWEAWLLATKLKGDVTLIHRGSYTARRCGVNVVGCKIPPKMKCEVLHLFCQPNPYAALAVKRIKAKKVVMTVVDGEAGRYWTSMFSRMAHRYLKKRVSDVIVHTEYQKQYLKEYRTHVHPPLVQPLKKRKKSKHPTVLMMTHLSPSKGIYQVMDTIANLPKTIKWVICDSGMKNVRADIKNKIKLLQEEGFDIVMKGVVEPGEELSRAWVYIYPFVGSHNTHAAPLSLFEAVQMKTHIVAPDLPGLHEYFDSSVLVSPDHLGEAVLRLLKSKKEPRDYLKQKFNNKKVVEMTKKLYLL